MWEMFEGGTLLPLATRSLFHRSTNPPRSIILSLRVEKFFAASHRFLEQHLLRRSHHAKYLPQRQFDVLSHKCYYCPLHQRSRVPHAAEEGQHGFSHNNHKKTTKQQAGGTHIQTTKPAPLTPSSEQTSSPLMLKRRLTKLPDKKCSHCWLLL